MTEVYVLGMGSYSDWGVVSVHRTLAGAVAAMKARHPPDAAWGELRPAGEDRWAAGVSWVARHGDRAFPCSGTYDVTRYDVEPT